MTSPCCHMGYEGAASSNWLPRHMMAAIRPGSGANVGRNMFIQWAVFFRNDSAYRLWWLYHVVSAFANDMAALHVSVCSRQMLLPRLPSLKEDVGEQVDKEIIFGGRTAKTTDPYAARNAVVHVAIFGTHKHNLHGSLRNLWFCRSFLLRQNIS